MNAVPSAPRTLRLPGERALDLSGRALVMGVVNCTDDSFYEGSRMPGYDSAVRCALAMIEDGADIVDIGGESTRPGSAYIDEATELERVIPVISSVRRVSTIPISVDTRKLAVARAAADAGADIVNDVSALEDDPEIAGLAAKRGLAVILMHKKGIPASMQDSPWYEDVVAEVRDYLLSRAAFAVSRGIPGDSIVLDPGFGFGKRLEDNAALVDSLDEIARSGYPVLMALSRKNSIGLVTGRPPEGRLAGTVAANAVAIMNGASIIRVHDVREGLDTAKIVAAFGKGSKAPGGMA